MNMSISSIQLPGLDSGAAFLGRLLRSDVYTVSLVASGLLLITCVGNQVLTHKDKDGFPFLSGLPIIGSWRFFTTRYHFAHEGLSKLGDVFSFNILQHRVVVVSGEEARKTYFGHRDLNFVEGSKVLFGASPKVEDIKAETIEDDNTDVSKFGKRLTSIIRPERLAKNLPVMLQDLNRDMDKWGTTGKFDPFDNIYKMVFQLSARALACREIADSPELVSRMAELYWDMETGATATAVLLPWFPSPARKRKEKATTDLYLLLKGALDKRIEEGRIEDDPAQALLDDGDSVNDIVTFIMGALFAGITNTGIMASWVTLYLGANPLWKEKVLDQTRSFVAKYASSNNKASLSSQLAQVPPKVWEEEMSALDLCLRETIRLTLTGTMLRRVLPAGQGKDDAEDVVFKGNKVSPGSFVAYPVTDPHLDPEIYSNPNTWDPSRYDRGEDRKSHWAFLGWGVGRHPCLGMRFAKLEVKLIIALFLMQYDYKLVDSSGNPVTTLPGPDRTNLYKTPPMDHVYIQFRSNDAGV